MLVNHPLAAVLVAALAWSTTPAQDPTPGAVPSPQTIATSLAAAHGLDRDDDGNLVGLSTRYHAVFTAAGLRFTPALGQAAPHDMDFRFRLAEVGRGEELGPVAAAAAERHGEAVHYRRAEVLERYTVRADGVKQDFVFETLPPGRGDLVVRGAVATELVPGAIGADGMRFALDGVGGVQIGEVVGIDAAGRRVAGSMRWNAGTIDFVLPSTFVDSAVLPLVVDPLVGTFFTTSLATADTDNLDVACDSDGNGGAGSWCVVFEQVLSAANSNIAVLRIHSGAFFGSLRSIESSAAVDAYGPRITNINRQDNWVVVYAAGQSVFARSYWRADVVGSTVTVTTSGQWPAVGGDSRTATGNSAFVVWTDPNAGGVHLCPLSLASPFATLAVGTPSVVASLYSGAERPDISHTGGAAGRWLVCYARFATPLLSTPSLGCRVWDGTTFATTNVSLGITANQLFLPGVDGDGDNWVVAYQVREVPANGKHDLAARSVRFVGGTLVTGTAVTIANSSNLDETGPSVAWLGSSALIAHSAEANGPGLPIGKVLSVDTIDCFGCEPEVTLDASSSDFRPRVGSRSSDGEFSGEAMIVWRAGTATGAAHARQFVDGGGSFASLGGGCGTGGTPLASCAHSSNFNFRIHLRGATPSTTTFLALGVDPFLYACGPCQLVVDPFTNVLLTTTTSAAGDAVIPFAIPPGAAGFRLRSQWITLGPSCASLLDLSNGMLVTVE